MTVPLDRLDWDDLRIFIEAVKNQSVSGAARRLSISHSTVSRRLQRLEYVVGASLFERSRDGLVLTSHGRTILRRAEEIESGIVGLRNDLNGVKDAGGVIRFATMEGIASLFLAPRIFRFLRNYPELHLELVTSPTTVHVAQREADLFLSFFKPYGHGMISTKVGRFAAGLFASPDYLDRRGMPETPLDLAAHEFVGYIDQFVHLDAVRWLEELVEKPRITFSSSSMVAQMFAASGGQGMVVLPYFCDTRLHGLVPVLPDSKVYRDLWLTYHQDMRSIPRLKIFCKFLDELFGNEAGYMTGENGH